MNKDYTLGNMAEELQMTTSAYRKIEAGITNAPTLRLLNIAAVLDVNVTDFFEDMHAMVADPKEKFGYATKDDVERITKMVQQLMKDFEKFREALPEKMGAKKQGRQAARNKNK